MNTKIKKVYIKIFATNTIVILLLMVALNLFFLSYVFNNAKEKRIYENHNLVNDITAKIDNQFFVTNVISDLLYSYKGNISDLLEFIRLDFSEYKENRLNNIFEDKNFDFGGTEDLVKRLFYTYDDIFNIATISKENSEVRVFNKNGQINFKEVINYDLMANKKIVSDQGFITHIIKINDISDLTEKGLFCITYSLAELNNIVKEYDDDSNAYVFNNNGSLIFKHGESLDYKNLDTLINQDGSSKRVREVNGDLYNLNYYNDDLTIIGKILKVDIYSGESTFYILLFLINIFVFIIAEGIVYLKAKRLNSRLDTIMFAMNKVQGGDLTSRIPETRDNDEINYMSGIFNEMCEELESYINRVYLAEISEKDSEMKRLQSQINPHFLYNTLEVIRMKAICSGNREVGKMLYNLAVLFRSQIKEKDIITIEKELEYSKMYLELFKFRYTDKFDYEIICDDNLLELTTVKFIIQPIIENYVVHGVRLSDDDNMIKISVGQTNDYIEICIRDNGTGIEKEKLNELKKMLEDKDFKSNSIGIVNVNQRVKNIYGKECGVRFTDDLDIGTEVIIKIKRV